MPKPYPVLVRNTVIQECLVGKSVAEICQKNKVVESAVKY